MPSQSWDAVQSGQGSVSNESEYPQDALLFITMVMAELALQYLGDALMK